MAEYRAVRAKHSMLDVIRTPELAAEVTLQPVAIASASARQLSSQISCRL